MTNIPDGADRAERRARIEAVLTNYPHLDETSLADLKRWFGKEASALDVGLIASNPDLSAAYQRLKADHLDRFTAMDLLRALLFMLAAGGGLLLIVWNGL